MNHTGTIFEQLGGTYTQVENYLLPDLIVDEAERQPIGKYGRMRRRYLKEHRPILFTNLLVSGNLYQHLVEIDHSCKERLDLIVHKMSKIDGVTERLKAADQMEWVRRMNNIQNRAEEIVLRELIYC